LGKQDSNDKPYGFGNTARRFPHAKRQKGNIAKDRFAFEQAMAGHDCKKIGKGGDFVVQQRDFLGEPVGEPMVVDVKTGNSKVTEAQEKRKRLLRGRYRIIRY
jgi:formylmethanofuran dehydrogenase subunit A